MSRLEGRVRRLVAQSGSPICPVCGYEPGAPVTFLVAEGPTDRDTPFENASCPHCRRITSFTIAIDSVRDDGA